MGGENGLIVGPISGNSNGTLPMARFDDISDDERKKVAAEAASLLLQLQGPRLGGPGAPMILGTSLSEELITPQWVAAVGENADKTALQSTGQTISLIESKGAAPGSPSEVVGYLRHATGTGRDNTAAQITSVSGSDISARIRDALDWIKANVPGDPMIRVLTAPAYQMTALGLYAGETLTGILLVTPSDGLPIENEHVYTPSEFRQLLGSVVPTSGLRR